MILKRIEMQGFKSFADRVSLDFEDGLTGIVGPNGCGKSNVVDAIRWVLGEQSSKTLRGESMQDVIFNGAGQRKSTSYCEVTLVFDNTTRIFELEMDEIAFTRKVYRGSGESEYFINRSPALLKSIHNLLRNTGIGKEGYSIIGQGQIQRLISAKPHERRNIFEDASGISRHKANKIEAERKLSRTEDNLEKLNLVLTGYKERLAPLEKQAENARKYVDLRTQLKYQEVNMFLAQVQNNAEEEKRITARIAGLREEELDREKEAQESEKKYRAKMDEQVAADLKIGALHKEQLSVVARLKATEGDANLHAARLEFNKEEEGRITSEIATFKNSLAKKEKEVADSRAGIPALKEAIAETEAEQIQAENKRAEITQQILEKEAERERANMAFAQAMEELADQKISEAEIKIKLSSLEERIAEATVEKQTLGSLVEAQESAKRTYEIALEKTLFEATRLEKTVKEGFEKYNEFGSIIQQANSDMRSLSNMIGMLDSRRKMLLAQKQNYEGFGHAVKNLLQRRKTEPEIAKRIDSVVAEIVKVPDKFTTALEVSLGATAQHIIVNDSDDAKFLVGYLREKRLGYTTFMPLANARPRHQENSFLDLKRERGCLGVADELITFEPKYKTIMSALLGNVMIFEDFDTARQAWHISGQRYKIVTLLGDVFQQGTISGGSRSSMGADLLKVDSEIKDAEAQYVLADKKYKVKIEEINTLELKRQEAERSAQTASNNLKEKQVQLASDEAKLENAVVQAQEALTSYNKITQQIAMMQAQQMELSARLGGESVDNAAASKAGQAQVQKNDGLAEQREQIYQKITALKVKITSYTRDLEQLENRATMAERESEILVLQITTGEAQLSEIKEKILIAETAINDVADSDTLAAENKRIGQEVEKLTAKKIELAKEADVANLKKEECLNVLSSIREQGAKAVAQLDRIRELLEQKTAYIYEEYGLNYQTALEERDPEFDPIGAAAEITNLKRSISRLGAVNPNAIEEFREVSEKHDSMSEEIQDLEKAKTDLISLIKEISKEMLEIFNREFKKINEAFKRIFKELFGGGTAELVMCYEDVDDPLDAGVEIKAKPPEKKIDKLSLLSGGEQTLTSLAVVLSIISVRKTPFCVFDEAEAALDESNASIVAKYMKKYSKITQFVCITHKKATMEEADRLYGVTMEEPGVSKMVAVSFVEAARHAVLSDQT